ncbi:ras GEF [Rickenella mellea]|uniref:Ras GEF n=1 Tax=Rickenella mellea TaxID=50990 RepID=A0A4Y7PKE7_9AGAM|nr:ras GEF [Rickenella mellea]
MALSRQNVAQANFNLTPRGVCSSPSTLSFFIYHVSEQPLSGAATIFRKLRAPEYIATATDNLKEWYLRPTYCRDEILTDQDGGIRGGTLLALIELLTTHEYRDPIFIKTFFLTYKSFTNLNELFDLLVARFNIQAPESLDPYELEEWICVKQTVVRFHVINSFKTIVTNSEEFHKDDFYILERMKDFCVSPDAVKLRASKHLLDLIERAQAGGDSLVQMTAVSSLAPTPPIQPKVSRFLNLQSLEVDALEMARQLTILESRFYNKIRAAECLKRALEPNRVGEHHDHIADVIQVSNMITCWVANTVLQQKDSRRRARTAKHFILIADHCRTLNNFSTMVAIMSCLNSPPIRRLKRTWDHFDSKCMSQLGTCEMNLDSSNNFCNYRSTLAKINPPCIPFIGVYLIDLAIIQNGSKDYLQPDVINFGKLQKTAEVVHEIKHWQSTKFNLTPIPVVLDFIEESLASFHDARDWNEYFWNMSLERESDAIGQENET